MSILDKKYVLKVDTKSTFFNPTPQFSISDNETSDFNIRVTNANKIINLSDVIAVMVVINPNNEMYSDFVEVEKAEEGLLYCNLSQSLKNIDGTWKARLMCIYGEERIVTSTFSYKVNTDEFVQLNQEVVNDNRFGTLTEMLSRLSSIELQETSRQEAETNRVEAERQREIVKEKLISDMKKLVVDTNKKIDDYKSEKDTAINLDLQQYKTDTTQDIDNYKNLKDAEIDEQMNRLDANEDIRINQEKARIKSEDARVVSEKNRVEEFEVIKEDYNTYKNVMISESNVAALQKNINDNSSQIKDKANKNEVGSPLIANSISEMIDITKVYVNGSDGKWYSWNGTTWVAGGIYNSQGIANKQITPEKTNFIDVVTDNLIYGTTYTKGKAVKPSDGTLYDVSSYQTTDFIPCTEGDELVFSGNTNLCFYDSAVIFLVGKQGGQWTSPVTVPVNAKYFRWSYPIKDEATSYVCLKGNTNINPKFYLNNDLFETTKEKLMLDLNINYPLKNKKINVLGDSNSSLDYLTPNWLQNIENRTGVIANNYGVSGTTIAYNENRENNAGKCFANRVGELNDCDVTIIMGGTNDVNSQIPLGNWEDTTNETLYGAINIIITTLLNKFPGKPIVWCTPIQDRNSYKNKPVANLETTVLGASAMANVNYTLLNGAIKLKCRQYGIHFINLYEESGINGADTNFVYYRNSTDTVHMSLLGHGRVSNIIQSKLEEII